jgi:xanthine dehydrogenase YagR molybdenum-binding subunit
VLLQGARGHGHNDFKLPLLRRLLQATCWPKPRRGLREAPAMEMNHPPRATPSTTTAGPHRPPIDRVDGRLKVTGKAPYAYEVQEGPGKPAYGFIVEATIAKGRVRRDRRLGRRSGARRAAGDDPPQRAKAGAVGPGRCQGPLRALVAATRETTACATTASRWPSWWPRASSRRVGRPADGRIRYETAPGEYDMAAARAKAEKPKDDEMQKADSQVGDFEPAFAGAPVQVDVDLHDAVHIHAQMEPHAALAWWRATA